MNRPPTWLKKGILVCHLPTRTVLEPERLYERSNSLHLTDPTGAEWKLSDCDRLRLAHLTKGGTFASEMTIAIHPDPRGLIVTDGCKKLLVRLTAPDNYAAIAARALARAFDGNIYSEEATPCS